MARRGGAGLGSARPGGAGLGKARAGAPAPAYLKIVMVEPD